MLTYLAAIIFSIARFTTYLCTDFIVFMCTLVCRRAEWINFGRVSTRDRGVAGIGLSISVVRSNSNYFEIVSPMVNII